MTQATSRRSQAGLSIVELLIALAISATMLAAVAAAIDASFYAYASAASSASTQSAARLSMQRMMILIRTTTLHDAYDPADATVTLGDPTQPPVRSVGIEMVDPDGRLLKLWWAVNTAYTDADLGDLWYQVDASDPQPMLEGVRIQRTDDAAAAPYVFTLASQDSDSGLLLRRATIDITAEPGADNTFALETYQGAAEAVRLISSTTPRRNIE